MENDEGNVGEIAEVEEGEPGSQTPYAGPQSHDLDELAGMQAPAGPSILETALEGDSVPAEFRGKKFADVLGMFSNLKTALRTSEEARTQALATTQLLAERQAPAPVQAPAPQVGHQADREPTDAEWKEMFENDPFAYQQKRFEIIEKRIAKGVDARLQPSTLTAAESSKQMARGKYPEAFEVLGKEIDEFVDQAFPSADARSSLAAPGAWERVVQYVQGANLDKIISHRRSKEASTAAAQRQEAERKFAAPVANGGRPATPRGGKLTPASLDETSKEIARNLMPELPPQKAYEEYCKHFV
jgi:hypothetical protein